MQALVDRSATDAIGPRRTDVYGVIRVCSLGDSRHHPRRRRKLETDFLFRCSSENEHVALVLDGAGWHSGKALRVPANITLVPLPAYSPELNPVERVWLYLKQRFLSLRLLNDYKAIVSAASKAWKRLCRETGRLTSLTSYPWIMRIRQVKH